MGLKEKVQNAPSILKFPKGHWKVKTYSGFDDVWDEDAEEIAQIICQGIEELTFENTMDPNELNFHEREKFWEIPDGEILSKILESGIDANEVVEI